MRVVLTLPAVVLALASAARAEEGDARRGAPLYRGCVACHSLDPGVHQSGPSLAGLWGKPAGKIDGFVRYSKGMKSADFVWNADTLYAWVADPRVMVPDTYMTFRGIKDDQQRADIVAFLKMAMAPGGGRAVVEKRLVPLSWVRGQQPPPLSTAPESARVTAIRHCGDSYFVTTADGATTPIWEMNVRLKVDSRKSGPEPGRPVLTPSGMAGDRYSVVFSGIEEIKKFVEEKC